MPPGPDSATAAPPPTTPAEDPDSRRPAPLSACATSAATRPARRRAAELRPERALGAVQLLHPLDDVDRHADRSRLVGERPRDGLADPPGRVGRELVAAAPVELLDGADQAERALLDQVEERQALVAVVLGDRDDQAQVRLDHPRLGLRGAPLAA